MSSQSVQLFDSASLLVLIRFHSAQPKNSAILRLTLALVVDHKLGAGIQSNITDYRNAQQEMRAMLAGIILNM